MTEIYYGQTIADPYLWLENWHDAKVAQWLQAQADYTCSTLGKIPGREKFLVRVKALDTVGTNVRNVQIWDHVPLGSGFSIRVSLESS